MQVNNEVLDLSVKNALPQTTSAYTDQRISVPGNPYGDTSSSKDNSLERSDAGGHKRILTQPDLPVNRRDISQDSNDLLNPFVDL